MSAHFNIGRIGNSFSFYEREITPIVLSFFIRALFNTAAQSDQASLYLMSVLMIEQNKFGLERLKR